MEPLLAHPMMNDIGCIAIAERGNSLSRPPMHRESIMPFLKGSQLNSDDRRIVLATYIHRFTKDHKPNWANRPRPDGSPYMPHFASDDEWLEHTHFHVTAKGKLDHRYHFCESSPTFPDGITHA